MAATPSRPAPMRPSPCWTPRVGPALAALLALLEAEAAASEALEDASLAVEEASLAADDALEEAEAAASVVVEDDDSVAEDEAPEVVEEAPAEQPAEDGWSDVRDMFWNGLACIPGL
jgi:hypothetical protein